MTSLSVTPEPGETNASGKLVSDLQTDVTIVDGNVSGTLNYVTGYTGYSELEADQSGHYLVLSLSSTPAGAFNTVEVVAEGSEPNNIYDDVRCVVRITDPETQTVRFVTTNDGYEPTTTVLDLSGLILEPQV